MPRRVAPFGSLKKHPILGYEGGTSPPFQLRRKNEEGTANYESGGRKLQRRGQEHNEHQQRNCEPSNSRKGTRLLSRFFWTATIAPSISPPLYEQLEPPRPELATSSSYMGPPPPPNSSFSILIKRTSKYL
jgi:hypothetical protein